MPEAPTLELNYMQQDGKSTARIISVALGASNACAYMSGDAI